MSLDFTGEHVVVVGGSSGIGNGIARAFRDAGAHVTATGTSANAGDYGEALRGITYHTLDITDAVATRAFAESVHACDVLVNSAASVAYKRKEFEIETFSRIVALNLNGLMHCCTQFHGKLRAAKGCIINIASLAAYHATRGNPAYGASKGGVVQLTKTLAVAWARDGIRVNGIAPGYVETKLTRVSKDNPEIDAAILARTPMGRWGTPEDMAGAALFLASDLARFVTGQTIAVDGGLSLNG
ncbi:MAG TPA: SDR family oxidoreductase [Candidatus Cybelea sp.]|nr:SDR family oxidoreductase [Candidatus Cybelea sp.]